MKKVCRNDFRNNEKYSTIGQWCFLDCAEIFLPSLRLKCTEYGSIPVFRKILELSGANYNQVCGNPTYFQNDIDAYLLEAN